LGYPLLRQGFAIKIPVAVVLKPFFIVVVVVISFKPVGFVAPVVVWAWQTQYWY
jgi:hypothetical protein